MYATGFFPADREQIYHVNPNEDDLYLVGTSEVPLTMLHYKKTLPAEKLPLRYVAYSSCFRREAGTYGKDAGGILRVHQFDKLEMYSFCHPDKSEEEHELIRGIEEEIMQDLKLPYQVLNICSGDLGNPAAKKYDIEAWIPSQNKYRELTSTSNCTDFQARRSQIKYKDKDGKPQILHTLNGTAAAIGRTIIAIYENYQNADGSINVPEILRQYVGKDKIEIKK
jgi:seryl-tRNA synthetase